jgi:hypothetical protein
MGPISGSGALVAACCLLLTRNRQAMAPKGWREADVRWARSEA